MMVSATPLSRHPACPVVVFLLALPATVLQAGVVATSATHDDIAVALDNHGSRLRLFSATGPTLEKQLSPPADTLCGSAGGGPVLVRGGTVWSVRAHAEGVHPVPVEKAVPAVNAGAALSGGQWAFLAGGRWTSGELIGAGLHLSGANGSRPAESQWVSPADRPQFIRSGILPDGNALLVGVKTRAVFDDTLRLRPWIFSVAGSSLRPRWLGTSFSHPFVDATFADGTPDEGDEICVTELTRSGRRQVLVYRMRKLMVVGVAASRIGPFGSRLRRLSVRGRDRDIVCTWLGGGRGRIVGMSVRHSRQKEVARLDVVIQTDPMNRPAAWDVGSCDRGPEAFVLQADGTVAVREFNDSSNWQDSAH